MSKRESYPTDNCNPYRGEQAYVVAKYPCQINTRPCEYPVPPEPEEPTEEEVPETPTCITMVYATNGDETLVELTYDPDNEIYTTDENGTQIAYDEALGWVLTSAEGAYTLDSLSPIGTYCSATDQAVTILPCDKAPVIVPEIPECLTLVGIEGADVPLTDFQETGGIFSSDDGNSTVLFDGTNWILSTPSGTFVGGLDENVPAGVYDDGSGNCALLKPCDEDAPEVADCVETVLTNLDPAPVIGQFNFDGSDYVPADPDQGSLSWNGTRWELSLGGVTYTGGNDFYNPASTFTSLTGGIVVIQPCA